MVKYTVLVLSILLIVLAGCSLPEQTGSSDAGADDTVAEDDYAGDDVESELDDLEADLEAENLGSMGEEFDI